MEFFDAMNKENESVRRIKFGNFHLSENAISVGDVVVIDDNIDRDWGEIRPESAKKKDAPAKLMMAFCIICLEGKFCVTLNQERYELSRNCGLICMPGAIAEHIQFSEDCKFIIGAISERNFGKAIMQSAGIVRKWLIKNNGLGIVQYPESVREAFVQSYTLFKKLWLFSGIKEKYAQDAAIGFFYFASAIFASIMSDQVDAQMDDSNVSRKKELTMRFLNDVHEYCGTERSVAFYAGRCCLSPKYFARIITETLGKKPGDIIKASVILEAKVLLVSNDYSVQQVSDKMHFPNSSFFCKYFKSATGCSPRQYQLYGEKAVKKS
ncbi:MAG: helix-turn-helix domain-containing protein [Candidatus Cryptobacteroides sp.]